MTFSKFYKYFHEVAINATFHYQGNTYIKQSTRTALMLCANKVFYMGMRDDCYVLLNNGEMICA